MMGVKEVEQEIEQDSQKEPGHVIEFRIGDEKFSIVTPLYPESYMDIKKAKTATKEIVLEFASLICDMWNPNAALGRFISVMDTAVKNALIAQVKSSGEITHEALQKASDAYLPLEGQVGLSYEEKIIRHIQKCVKEDVEKGLFESLEDYNSKKAAWKTRYDAICMKRKDAPKKPKKPTETIE